MGMLKDMLVLTKQANELKKSSGSPGMRELLEQAPEQLKQAPEQLQRIEQAQPEAPAILRSGDPEKIAIDWDAVGEASARGEIRPA